MCGLFGFSGWDKASVPKLKMLGLYNKTRGTDSCGYYFNERLVKGIDKNKSWDAFIENNIIDGREKSNLFIGHTRWSTVGSHTEENAHPFNVNNQLIIAHNGTIDNIWQLCTENQINHSGIHVDSLGLGHLINKIGYPALEMYRGYAALLLHRLSEPDTLYVYHGASKEYEADDKLTEERPMYFMSTAEGIYFSSLKNSLLAIRESEREVPEMLEHNRVFKITKGKFGRSKTIINRDNANLGLKKTTYHYQKPATTTILPQTQTQTQKTLKSSTVLLPNHYTTDYNTNQRSNDITNIINNAATNARYLFESEYPATRVENKNILNETLPLRCFENNFEDHTFIYYHRGRHYESSEKNKLCHGIMFTDKDGVVYEDKQDKVNAHYFYRGVLLKNEKAWMEVQEHIITKTSTGMIFINYQTLNFAQAISRFSKYAVTNLADEGGSVTYMLRTTWWYDLVCAKGSVQPVWSDRNYIFSYGNLTDIKSDHKNKDILFVDATNSVNANLKFNPANQSSYNERQDSSIKEMELIKSLYPYFTKVYTDIDTFYADVPSTVIDAIGLYVADTLNFDSSDLTGDDTDLTEGDLIQSVDTFIKSAIEDHVPINDAMDESFPTYVQYCRKAYLAEIAEAHKSKETIFNEPLNHNERTLRHVVHGFNSVVEEAQIIEDSEDEKKKDRDGWKEI